VIGVDDLLALVEGQPLNDRTQAWLREGLQRSIATGAPLERALGLTTLPGRSWRDAVRQRKAKSLVWQAADLIPARDAWSRAKLLSAEIASFRRYRWSRLLGLDAPPTALSDLECILLDLFGMTGGRPPESPQRLYELLTAATDRSESTPLLSE